MSLQLLMIVETLLLLLRSITIIDTTAPVLTIPSDYTAECSDDHPMDDASCYQTAVVK